MQHAPHAPGSPARRRIAMALPLWGGMAWAGSAARVPSASASKAASTDLFLRGSWALMGTRVDIVAQGPDAGLLRDAMAQSVVEMQRLEAMMSRYRPDSEVTRIHLAAGIAPVAVSPELMTVLQSAQRTSALSQGAFDPTVGSLSAWDFTAGSRTVPSPNDIARQQRLVDARALVLDAQAGTAFLARQGMALDLGGIAKLPILEAGLRRLRSLGVENALINGGGDVLVEGMCQGRPWRVGLRDPRAPDRLLGVVSVAGTAVVASSGDYERFFLHQGQRLHHILNPRTGRPTSGVHGVSLVARTVAEVNGLGAALMVQGASAGPRWAARMPQLAMLTAARDGSVWQSAGMKAMLEPVVS
ncbi:MAG: FAD:protein FMN transferase [Acidovorax sp.]|nr:MAG: FAD:protein FMN transferase [Acidovorax sp.]